MSKFINALLVASFAVGTVLLAITPAISSPEQPNAFNISRDLLSAFYPEIFGNGRYVGFSTGQPVDNNSWSEIFGFEFKVTRFGPGVSWNPTFDPRTGQMRPIPENTTFLQGSSWIGYHGEIIRFAVDGDLAHSQQNDTLRKLIQSHPEWSEDQGIHALKEAGARYGPAEKQLFIEGLHLERAERVLGRPKIKLVEFQGLSPDHVGSFVSLFWIVQVEGQFPDGTHRTYGLGFEPFEGKLTDIHEMPSPK